MHLYADKRECGTYYKIRETFRDEHGKIKVRNVLYLGNAEKIFERFRNPVAEDAELKAISFGPAAALKWAFEDLGLDELFTELLDPEEGHDFPAWKKIYLLVWRRFLQNLSMKKAVEHYGKQIFPFWWREEITTVQRLYQFLGDELGEGKIRKVQEELARRSVAGESVKECYFDTTDYYTYVEDDTKYLRIGRSKEGIVGRRLVGLALALSDQGMPVLGEAYPGNRNDTKLFSGLFQGVCERLEAAGSDLENVTLIFDRGFDSKDNFKIAHKSSAHVVAAVKRDRKTVGEVLDSMELEEFQKSYETSHGECYVYDGGRADIGDHSWRVILSYHDSTREKVREKMDRQEEEAEEVLTESLDRLERGGPGRPPTQNSVRKKLEKILGKRYHCLNWSLNLKEKKLDWKWNDEWDRKYELAGVLPIVTDHDDWTSGKIAKTYFQRKDIEDVFHLTKKALIVPVEPPYVKEDHLIRAHLFLIYIGLLCYQHIKKKLPNTMTDDDIKSSLKELTMIIATEDGNLQFKPANVNEETRPLLTAMNLEQYLPE